ncbi:MAG: tagaturonate epimerase family protein [Rubrobacteraceae bacterium]
MRDLGVLPRSVVAADDTELGFARADGISRIVVLSPKQSPVLKGFEGDASRHGGRTLLVGPTNSRNVEALREALPHLRPRTLGLVTSAGLGDRLGLATPGHARAMRVAGGDVAPIFAQQSIREMGRTNRSPRDVIDDATWGAFAEGRTSGFGADADHLKTVEHVDACVAAGYTFFTFDPGEYVDDDAEAADASALRSAFDGLPWDDLEDSPEDLRRRYLGERFDAEEHEISFEEITLRRAAIKYGRAVAHSVRLYRHLKAAMGDGDFEVEVSVDETESPTTHAQHFYVARELGRLGVRFVSLAPRYVGRFEKGVDYIGDVPDFEADLAVHAAIARTVSADGPYKLSLHSGSDKFSIYPAFVRQTRGVAHLKTAGTSYLEALRVAAALDADLFQEIYVFARDRYEEDRASYHVSAEVNRAPAPGDVSETDLPGLLEQFDAREILHVTFGSVLGEARLRKRLFSLLREHPEHYAAGLETHFTQHLEPFATKGRA